MLEYMRARHAAVLEAIRSSGELGDDTVAKLIAALDEFAKAFQPSTARAEASEEEAA